MEEIKVRLNKLTDVSKYRLKSNIIKEVLEEYKINISKKSTFEQAVSIDQKHHPVYVNHEKIVNIIDEYLNLEKINVKYSPNSIIDGYGNIAVSYNGDPYLTLRLLLMSLRTHNNIVFFSKKYYALNTKLVETLNMIIEKKGYARQDCNG